MFDVSTWVEVVGGLIAIVTAVVVLTVYFTRLKLEGGRQLRGCQLELEEKRSTISALEASVHGLTQTVQLLQKGKDDALSALHELNGLVEDVRKTTGATAGSILIRNPYSDGSLVFLVVHGEAADKIRKMKTPIDKSLAGAVLQTGRYSIFPAQGEVANARHDQTDKKSSYQSNYVLSLPLQVGATTVGVLQLLNKQDGMPFHERDLGMVQPLCSTLAVRVRTLASDPDTLKLLGIAEIPDETTASILFATSPISVRSSMRCRRRTSWIFSMNILIA